MPGQPNASRARASTPDPCIRRARPGDLQCLVGPCRCAGPTHRKRDHRRPPGTRYRPARVPETPPPLHRVRTELLRPRHARPLVRFPTMRAPQCCGSTSSRNMSTVRTTWNAVEKEQARLSVRIPDALDKRGALRAGTHAAQNVCPRRRRAGPACSPRTVRAYFASGEPAPLRVARKRKPNALNAIIV